MQNVSRKKLIIALVIFAVIIGAIVIAAVISRNTTPKNQFGTYIKIQNYDKKIKNLSGDIKDAIQSSLYNTVKSNSPADFDAGKVSDAVIRDGSDTQKYDKESDVYSGSFIVDMASIKQSYLTQYSYSKSNTVDTGGSPVVISCLDTKDLKYGAFKCTDLVQSQSSPNDMLLQYLPYNSFTFNITPSLGGSDGKTLTLLVDLSIPDSDMPADAAGRAAVVASYKSQVMDWVNAKGVDASKYTYVYNYNDNGDRTDNVLQQGD